VEQIRGCSRVLGYEFLRFSRDADLSTIIQVPAKQNDMPAQAGFAPTGVYHPVGPRLAHCIAGLPTGCGDTILALWCPWDGGGIELNTKGCAGVGVA